MKQLRTADEILKDTPSYSIPINQHENAPMYFLEDVAAMIETAQREAIEAAAENAKVCILLKERGREDWGPITSDTARMSSGAQITVDKQSILKLKP